MPTSGKSSDALGKCISCLKRFCSIYYVTSSYSTFGQSSPSGLSCVRAERVGLEAGRCAGSPPCAGGARVFPRCSSSPPPGFLQHFRQQPRGASSFSAALLQASSRWFPVRLDRRCSFGGGVGPRAVWVASAGSRARAALHLHRAGILLALSPVARRHCFCVTDHLHQVGLFLAPPFLQARSFWVPALLIPGMGCFLVAALAFLQAEWVLLATRWEVVSAVCLQHSVSLGG